MKKNCSLHIKLSKDNLDKLKARADKVGLSLSSYCLFVLLNAKPYPAQVQE